MDKAILVLYDTDDLRVMFGASELLELDEESPNGQENEKEKREEKSQVGIENNRVFFQFFIHDRDKTSSKPAR